MWWDFWLVALFSNLNNTYRVVNTYKAHRWRHRADGVWQSKLVSVRYQLASQRESNMSFVGTDLPIKRLHAFLYITFLLLRYCLALCTWTAQGRSGNLTFPRSLAVQMIEWGWKCGPVRANICLVKRRCYWRWCLFVNFVSVDYFTLSPVYYGQIKQNEKFESIFFESVYVCLPFCVGRRFNGKGQTLGIIPST